MVNASNLASIATLLDRFAAEAVREERKALLAWLTKQYKVGNAIGLAVNLREWLRTRAESEEG